ncbi:MAG TPA: pentapeptide repeat-containing protein [Stenomitos sp.]
MFVNYEKIHSLISFQLFSRNEFIENLLKNKKFIVFMASAFVLLISWIVFTFFLYENKKGIKQISLSPSEVKRIESIKKSIKNTKMKVDPFIAEILIQQESKRFGLSADEYRKLINIRNLDIDLFSDMPKTNLLDQAVWFYQDLSAAQRRDLIYRGFLGLVTVLSHLTILFAGAKFLLEIPQRKRQAKYQAWQVVHAAYNQKVSGARIAALEHLVEQGESLSGLTLEEGADLSGSDLSRANLSRANLNAVNLSDANLNGVNFSKANLSGANLSGANLSGANLSEAYLCKADFSNANLSNTKLIGANLGGVNISFADLSETDFSKSDFSNQGAYDWVKIVDSTLKKTIFIGANLSGLICIQSKFNGVDFSEADLCQSTFYKCDLGGVNLKKSNLTKTRVEDVNFSGANLEGINLGGSNLKNIDFNGVNLKLADIRDVDLRNVKNLTQEQVNCASGNKNTQLPDPLFSPQGWIINKD